jgi:hypothetical protein
VYVNERDPLVWPALYCFRHFLELALKQHAADGQPLGVQQPPKGKHELQLLWPGVRDGVTRHLRDPEAAERLEQTINFFHVVDHDEVVALASSAQDGVVRAGRCARAAPRRDA